MTLLEKESVGVQAVASADVVHNLFQCVVTLLEGEGSLKAVAWDTVCRGHFDIITFTKTIPRSHVKHGGKINHLVRESQAN